MHVQYKAITKSQVLFAPVNFYKGEESEHYSIYSAILTRFHAMN